MGAAAEGNKNLLCNVYAGWGNFLCKQSRRFGHQFSQSDCFIVTSCWGLRHLHSPFAPCGCSQSRPRIWFYKWFSKIITLPSACHSNYSLGNFARGLLAQGLGDCVGDEMRNLWDSSSVASHVISVPSTSCDNLLLQKPAVRPKWHVPDLLVPNQSKGIVSEK